MSTTSTQTLPRTGTYVIDPAHTEVGFVARHLVGTKVRGRFTDVSRHLHGGREPRGLQPRGCRTGRRASTPTSSSATTTCGRTTSSTSRTTRRSP